MNTLNIKHIIIILLAICGGNAFGQDSFLFKQQKLSFYQEKEDSLASESYKDEFTFGVPKYPFNERVCKNSVKLPCVIYKRKDKDFFTGKYIWYSWTPDSLVKTIRINRGFINNSMNSKASKKVWRKNKTKEKKYIAKYDQLQSEIIQMIGEPTESKVIEDTDDFLSKETRWYSDDRLVVLYMGFNRNAVKPKQNSISMYGFKMVINIHFK